VVSFMPWLFYPLGKTYYQLGGWLGGPRVRLGLMAMRKIKLYKKTFNWEEI
jgi:hypothetical protein